MKKVVLDTNVLISGIVFGGLPRKILELVIETRIANSISGKILDEIKGVLSGKKFNYPEGIIRLIISELESVSNMVFPKIRINVIKKDPDDNMILECAVESGSSIIISGDSHLLELKEFRGIKIVTPSEFLDSL